MNGADLWCFLPACVLVISVLPVSMGCNLCNRGDNHRLPYPVLFFFSLLGTVPSVPGVRYSLTTLYIFFQVGFRALFTELETSNLLQFEAIVCQLNSSSSKGGVRETLGKN